MAAMALVACETSIESESGIAVERTLYFESESGDPVVVEPGRYTVGIGGNSSIWLTSAAGDPVAVQVTQGEHEESLDEPLVILESGDGEDVHLVVLRNDGTTLDALASTTGVRGRGTSRIASALSKQRIAVASKRIPRVAPNSGIYEYTAKVNGTVARQGQVRAGSLTWRCRGDRCRISGPWPTPGVGACNLLAKQVGQIRRYGHPGKQLNAAQLNQCNKGVEIAGTAKAPPKDGGPAMNPGASVSTTRPGGQISPTDTSSGGRRAGDSVPMQVQQLEQRFGSLEEAVEGIASASRAACDVPPSWNRKLPAAERFTPALNGGAYCDLETGVIWEETPSTHAYTYRRALDACTVLQIDGRLGWRLPTIEEMGSLVDTANIDRIGVALPLGHPFKGPLGSVFWTATLEETRLVGQKRTPYYMDMGSGVVITRRSEAGDVGGQERVWCVRGGEKTQIVDYAWYCELNDC